MGASTYLANSVVDHVLKTASFAQPTNIYASLHSADPATTGASGLCQISDNGWCRRNGFSSLPALRHSDLRDQRTPAGGEEPTLLRKRDVSLTAAADTEVLL